MRDMRFGNLTLLRYDARVPADVAICIPTYNQADYLPIAVESAGRQDYRGTIEIWVGDDASTDHTGEVLADLESRIPSLRVLRQHTNKGIPENCSTLMRQPDADYLVRLDSDDELARDYVARLVEMMDRHPRAGYGHTAITQIDDSGDRIDTRRLFRGTGFQDAETSLQASLSGYRTVANVLMFRREALEELDFYEGRPAMRQDYDLAVRMADKGYGNVYLDEPLARYRVWADVKGVRAKRKALELEGYIQVFDEAFAPAWRRRGWNSGELTRQRRKLANHHCPSCFQPQYSSEERDRLIVLLHRLGGSRRLALRIRLCQAGGARWLASLSQLRYRLKTAAKAVLKPLAGVGRRASGPEAA